MGTGTEERSRLVVPAVTVANSLVGSKEQLRLLAEFCHRNDRELAMGPSAPERSWVPTGIATRQVPGRRGLSLEYLYAVPTAAVFAKACDVVAEDPSVPLRHVVLVTVPGQGVVAQEGHPEAQLLALHAVDASTARPRRSVVASSEEGLDLLRSWGSTGDYRESLPLLDENLTRPHLLKWLPADLVGLLASTAPDRVGVPDHH